jgi:hypothetical protein
MLLGVKNKNRRELEKFWTEKAQKETQAKQGSRRPARNTTSSSTSVKPPSAPKSL